MQFDLSAMNCQRIKSCKVDDLDGNPSDWMMEPKYDGFRLIAHIKDDGTVDTWTRAMKSQNGRIPYVDEELLKLFPPNTVLDGEIVALQQIVDDDTGELSIVNDFEHVQSIMLSKPDKAVAKAKAKRPLDYMLFDCMYFDGQDVRLLPFEDRRQLLQDRFMLEVAWAMQRISLTSSGDATQEKHDKLVAMGFEGTICKRKDGLYLSGKRPKDQMKLKVQTEVDVVLIDVKPGTPGSQFDGMVGALIFGQPLADMPQELRNNVSSKDVRVLDGVDYVIRGKCSGITFTERERLTKLWDKRTGIQDRQSDGFFGRVFAFNHMGKYPDGVKFRHPQFKRWRKDKPIGDVIWHDG